MLLTVLEGVAWAGARACGEGVDAEWGENGAQNEEWQDRAELLHVDLGKR